MSHRNRMMSGHCLRLALFLSSFLPLAHALVSPSSAATLGPRPPNEPAPQWLVRSMQKMRGGGDMPLPLPLSRQNSFGVDAASTAKAGAKLDLGQLAFVLLGAGSLIPWNVVILAIDFFASICPHYQVGQVAAALALSNMLCSVGCLSLMVRFRIETRIPVKIRVCGGFLAQCAIFASVVVASQCLSSSSSSASSSAASLRSSQLIFRLIVLFGCLLGTSDSIVQGGLAGYASKLSPRYAQSLSTGQSVGGLLMVGVRVLSKVFAGEGNASDASAALALHRLSATIFFSVAGVVILACLHLFTRLERVAAIADTIAAQRMASAIRSLSADSHGPATPPAHPASFLPPLPRSVLGAARAKANAARERAQRAAAQAARTLGERLRHARDEVKERRAQAQACKAARRLSHALPPSERARAHSLAPHSAIETEGERRRGREGEREGLSLKPPSAAPLNAISSPSTLPLPQLPQLPQQQQQQRQQQAAQAATAASARAHADTPPKAPARRQQTQLEPAPAGPSPSSSSSAPASSSASSAAGSCRARAIPLQLPSSSSSSSASASASASASSSAAASASRSASASASASASGMPSGLTRSSSSSSSSSSRGRSRSQKKGLERRLRGTAGAVGGLFFVSVIAWPTLCSQIQSASPDPAHWFPVKMAAVWSIFELCGRRHAEGRMVSARGCALPILARLACIPVLAALSSSSSSTITSAAASSSSSASASLLPQLLSPLARDALALLLVAALSSSLGFFSSVLTAYAANKAELQEREWAGQFVQFSIAAGLAGGSCAAFLLNRFLLN